MKIFAIFKILSQDISSISDFEKPKLLDCRYMREL